jgi:hypothetical protein
MDLRISAAGDAPARLRRLDPRPREVSYGLGHDQARVVGDVLENLSLRIELPQGA